MRSGQVGHFFFATVIGDLFTNWLWFRVVTTVLTLQWMHKHLLKWLQELKKWIYRIVLQYNLGSDVACGIFVKQLWLKDINIHHYCLERLETERSMVKMPCEWIITQHVEINSSLIPLLINFILLGSLITV